jgi:hypothetical protein
MSIFSILSASRRRAAARAALLLPVLAAVALAVGVSSSGAAVPTGGAAESYTGNPTCETLGLGSTVYKIENPGTSTTTLANGRGTIAVTVTNTDDGPVFKYTFTSETLVLSGLLVKGGPGGNEYPGGTSGEGLHAPVNPSNGKYYGLSHLSFCTEPKPEDPDCEPGQYAPEHPNCPEKPEDPDCEPGQYAPEHPNCPERPQDPPNTPSNSPFTPFTPQVTPPAPVTVTAPSTTAEAAVVRGSARMQAPSGCRSRTFTVRVSGREIRRITFTLNGRRLKVVRVRGTSTGRVYTLRVNPAKLPAGRTHRVVARVLFTATSRTQARTLRTTFQRCLQGAVGPRFTG